MKTFSAIFTIGLSVLFLYLASGTDWIYLAGCGCWVMGIAHSEVCVTVDGKADQETNDKNRPA